MEKDKACTPSKGKDIHVGTASDFETASDSDIEMATDILEKLTHVGQIQNGSKSECCIYRVPEPLRNVNWKAYAPLLISIGPLHRKNKRLEAMEKEKLKYFEKLTERDGMDEKKMRDIVISIKNQEERLRNCYSEKFILMESGDFVNMILLDAVFIIQVFLESKDDTDGPKNFEPRMTFDIREDLLLLENQLPLFILQEIYDRVYPRSQDAKAIPFLDLATCHFGKYSFLKRVETSPGVEEETSPRVEGSRHFTDLLRNLMLSGAIQRMYNLHPVKLKYSAVKLLKAGVRFEASKDKCLVNIKFDKGVLEIPRLEVDHNFERRIRNIMALEQCRYSYEAYICSYMKFMDHLIDSAEDVGLLVRKGIIVHRLGENAAVSNMINLFCENIDNAEDVGLLVRKGNIVHRLGEDVAVSNMINNFCKYIDDKYTCFGDISKALNDYYENPWSKVKLVYFRNMWRGTGTISGAILLILTFIQTISSVKSLF